MEIVTFLIALVALVIASLAYTRAGGIEDVHRQIKALGSATDTLRTKTADALDRLEGTVRGSRDSGSPAASDHSEVRAEDHPTVVKTQTRRTGTRTGRTKTPKKGTTRQKKTSLERSIREEE